MGSFKQFVLEGIGVGQGFRSYFQKNIDIRIAKIIKGKKIAGYYSLEDDITNAGAIYTDKPAVIDGKIITTAHYKDMGPWMKATLSFFNEKQK